MEGCEGGLALAEGGIGEDGFVAKDLGWDALLVHGSGRKGAPA